MTIVSEGIMPDPGMIPLAVREQTAYVDSGPVVVDSVKVVFTISGWARVSSPLGEVLLESGSILTIPAGIECRGFPDGHARTVTFYFHPEYLVDQMRWLSATHPLVHNLHRALKCEPQLQQLQLAASAMRDLAPTLGRLARLGNSDGGDFALLSMATSVFHAVGHLNGIPSDFSEVSMATGVTPRREVTLAIALMRADLGRPWRIDVLAREVALSGSQLARLFRAQVGISPAAYLRQLRTDQMAELLATTRLGVGEIASAVGWSDPAVASRAFKQRYGVAPRASARFKHNESHELYSIPARLP